MSGSSSSIGHHIGVEQPAHLSFEVVENGIRSLGRNEDGKERFLIKVKFGNGKVVAFRTESKSLNTAFEMIEVFGQQTKDLKVNEFDAYMNTSYGKRMWFDMTNISKNPGLKIDQVIGYKRDRHGTSLEYAFQQQKYSTFHPSLTISNAVIDELKKQAKLHQARLDASRLDSHLVVEMNKVN